MHGIVPSLVSRKLVHRSRSASATYEGMMINFWDGGKEEPRLLDG